MTAPSSTIRNTPNTIQALRLLFSANRGVFAHLTLRLELLSHEFCSSIAVNPLRYESYFVLLLPWYAVVPFVDLFLYPPLFLPGLEVCFHPGLKSLGGFLFGLPK